MELHRIDYTRSHHGASVHEPNNETARSTMGPGGLEQ